MASTKLSVISEALTPEVIGNIFRLKTRSEDRVIETSVTRAGAGEGLISAVYRINVASCQFSTSFVAKGLVKDLLLRKTLNCEIYFTREILFYSKILPALSDTQKSLKAKENIENYIPICYSSYCDGRDDYLLLDDLSESGFQSISYKPKELEKEGILKTIAHLHAVSMAMRLKNPELFFKLANECPEIYYRDDRKEWYCKYLKTAMDIDLQVVYEYENDSIYYNKFLSVIRSDVYEHIINITSTWGDHVVLNHGDCWCPNFMTKRDQVVAIDFQLLRFSSPVTDLCQFLFCNTISCSSKEEFLKSVDVYYSYLDYFLRDMNLDIERVFSRQALNEELKKFGWFGFLTALSTIPLIASEKCDVMGTYVDKFSGYDVIPLEDLWRLTPIKSQEHRMHLVNALHTAVDVGLI